MPRPDSSLECTGSSCGRWSAESWSACDFKACTIVREVKCISDSYTNMTEAFCDAANKPILTQQCADTKFCENSQKYLVSNYNHSLLYTGVLSYSDWSVCSVECGQGNQSRDVMCLLASKQSVVLPLSQCDTKAVESTLRECEVGKCEYKLIEKWGKVGCDKATEK